MLCCIAGVAAIATGAASGLFRRWRGALLGMVALGLTSLAALHLDHYAARAAAHDRDILEEIRATPLCTGAPRA